MHKLYAKFMHLTSEISTGTYTYGFVGPNKNIELYGNMGLASPYFSVVSSLPSLSAPERYRDSLLLTDI